MSHTLGANVYSGNTLREREREIRKVDVTSGFHHGLLSPASWFLPPGFAPPPPTRPASSNLPRLLQPAPPPQLVFLNNR